MDEYKQPRDSLWSIARALELDLQELKANPDWAKAVELYFLDWFQKAIQRLEELHKKCEEYRTRRDAAIEAERRWANRMREMEIRWYHAKQIIDGQVPVPTINQWRKLNGLEELPQLGGDYAAQQELGL